MYFSSREEQFRILLKLSLIALYILVAYDFAILVAGYFAIQANIAESLTSAALVRNVIFLLAVAELIATYFVKISMLKKTKKSTAGDAAKPGILPYPDLLRITIVIAAMCSAISTYGLVLVLLGNRFEILLLFIALSLIGYQFFRLRPRDFERDDTSSN
ncbi:MAG: hypothetical protein A2W25_00020 [candidate division Zixibacteria bacterium RBG_16_53_22]|nr:MAG: hypothetical protein A2W25_00020 [candidate division Zixibacteria bacterium RBG_16_53_22]